MNCNHFAASLGYHCAETEGGGVVVTTPFRMPNGASIPVYIEPAGDGYRLYDAGELLYEAIVSGAHLPDRRRLRGVGAALQRLGARLTDEGDVELVAGAGELASGFARFVEAALEVARWNEHALGATPNHEDLVDEVHQLLLARSNGARTIERNVSIDGFTRRPLVFDFREGGRLVDCISGSMQASAFEVRKLLDLRSLSAYENTEVLVIVDDRQDPQKAAEEMGLISRLANAQSLSSLRTAAGVVQTVQ